jgi:hypothetical protein
MDLFLYGAAAMACATAGLLFLRLWRESKDRLYVMFAIAFWLEALSRTMVLLAGHPNEAHPALYLLRLAGYGCIVVAIIDKNIKRSR